MDLFKTFKTDDTKEQEGVWIALDGKSRIKVARLNNSRYREALKKQARRFEGPLRAQTLTHEAKEGLLNDLLADTILLDWEGMTSHGEPFPYSRENAKSVLTDMKDFRELVMSFAEDVENYRPAPLTGL